MQNSCEFSWKKSEKFLLKRAQMLKIAIDRGGTFTDIYAVYGDKVVVKKILSESPFYEDSNTQAIKEVFKELGIEFDLKKIEWIRLGTTVGTNALLERKGLMLLLW
jgi:5-oxoprolinase (ATP-hydrolysing)